MKINIPSKKDSEDIYYLFNIYNDISIELYSDYNWVDHVYVTVTATKFV
jgi:hypothetical protein